MNKLEEFLENFIDIKYSYSETVEYNKAPFYFLEKEDYKLNEIKLSDIKKQGINCVGLINIIRRHYNLEIPKDKNGNHEGTSTWFEYLNKNNFLEKIDYKKIYETGTLLIQDYNPEDQGHVAIIINKNNDILINSYKIHAIEHPGSKKYNKVIKEKFMDYPFYKRYTHICKSDNWINR